MSNMDYDQTKNSTEIIDHGNGIKCTIKIESGSKYEIWTKDDKKHRDNDLPAHIRYHDNDDGVFIVHQYWYTDGKINRSNDKPAVIHYSKHEVKESESWFLDDKNCRTDLSKPITIEYNDEDGTTEEWYISNINCTKHYFVQDN